MLLENRTAVNERCVLARQRHTDQLLEQIPHLTLLRLDVLVEYIDLVD